MKLLIEISEEAYKLLQTDGVDWLGAEHILNAVANGKPLDDVLNEIKAEIETDTEKWWYGVNDDCFIKLSDVLEIIDKYKAESEDKE